jgi:hypothetical protein
MEELGIILDEKIKCQNCDFTLALRNEEDSSFTIPSDINYITQPLGRYATLITLQCKKCGCFVQVVSSHR